MKKLIYLVLFICAPLFSQTSTLFEEGNAAYAAGNYEEAVEKYNQILESGETAVAVHYNLGNAHYKLNNIAPSIYHYEKALQLDPQDEDVRNNLVIAQSMAVDAIEEAPGSEFSAWIRSGLLYFSGTGWAWLSIFLMLFFVGLFLAYLFSRKPLRKRIFFVSALFFFVVALGSVFMGYSRQNIIESESFAIVFAEETAVRSEPNRQSPEAFTLHEGTKVEVLENFQEWSKIELVNGSQGWIEQQKLKML